MEFEDRMRKERNILEKVLMDRQRLEEISNQREQQVV